MRRCFHSRKSSTLTDRRTRFPERLETPRLVIRPYVIGDVEALFNAINGSRATLKQFLPWAETGHLDQANTRQFIVQALHRWQVHEDMLSLVITGHRGALLGGIGLQAINWSVPRVELGYWLADSSAGHGIMQETVRAVSRVCLSQFRVARIEIRCDVRNWRSARVAERCGFHLDGTLRHFGRSPIGALTDVQVWSLTPEEFTAIEGEWDAQDSALRTVGQHA